MSLFKSYIIKAAQDSLVEQTAPPQEVVEPAVADPDSVSAFSDEMVRRIEFYKDDVLLISDFEGFMLLLDKISSELGLAPVDRTNLAALLNRFRVDSNIEPF